MLPDGLRRACDESNGLQGLSQSVGSVYLLSCTHRRSSHRCLGRLLRSLRIYPPKSRVRRCKNGSINNDAWKRANRSKRRIRTGFAIGGFYHKLCSSAGCHEPTVQHGRVHSTILLVEDVMRQFPLVTFLASLASLV